MQYMKLNPFANPNHSHPLSTISKPNPKLNKAAHHAHTLLKTIKLSQLISNRILMIKLLRFITQSTRDIALYKPLHNRIRLPLIRRRISSARLWIELITYIPKSANLCKRSYQCANKRDKLWIWSRKDRNYKIL